MFSRNGSVGIWLVPVVAVVFGLLTIKSGGAVLFVDGVDRQAAGDYVPFVLWFIFLSGFVYIIAGVGIWMQKQWAAKLAVLIAVSILAVYAIFGLYILNGGSYEMRTVAAMSMRSVVWAIIAMFVYRKMIHE